MANFKPPAPYENHEIVVVRLVADQGDSSSVLLSNVQRHFARARPSLMFEESRDPAEQMRDAVTMLQQEDAYPIFLIERFHSFARVADNRFMTLLSCLRTLEHEGDLTTIALSPVGYDVIRKRLSATLPFVNSAYGDNHDQAVMQPLDLKEFTSAALVAGVPHSEIKCVYELGGGPDVVYRAILDEMPLGFNGIETRCVSRTAEFIYRFLEDAVGAWAEFAQLYYRLATRRAEERDRAFLNSLPFGRYFVREGAEGLQLAGPIIQAAVSKRLREEPKSEPSAKARPGSGVLNVVFVAANPDVDLDLEEEIRSVQISIQRSIGRDSVKFQCALSARAEDIIQSLRAHRPNVLHFSGHGSKSALYLRQSGGREQGVQGAALAAALKDRGVRLVVMNACSSDGYSDALAAVVDVVICTTEEVEDETATYFSETFYASLSQGFTVAEAFRDATDAVSLRGFHNVYLMKGDGDFAFGVVCTRSAL